MSSELHFHALTDSELDYVSGGGGKLGIDPGVTGGSSTGGMGGGDNNVAGSRFGMAGGSSTGGLGGGF